MIRKKVLILILLILSGTALIGQEINWSFYADMGLSHIYTNREFTHPEEDVIFTNTSEYKNTSSYSFSYGTVGDVKLFKNISLSSGLSLLKMRGIHEVTNFGLISIDGSASSRQYTTKFLDQTLNFALPLSLKYNLKKLNFKIGVQALYLLKRKTDFKTTTIDNNSTITLNESSLDDPFKKLDYGWTGGISYNVYKHFNVDLKFYWGLNNIIESSFRNNNIFKYSRKNQRLSLGISYYLDDQNN